MSQPSPSNEILSVDMHDLVEGVLTFLRSVGAEVASPWFYLQFGLILAGAGIAFAANAAIQARVDASALERRSPLPVFRHLRRVLVTSAATAVFAVLMIGCRIIMWHTTWPSRSYLLMV